jgi:hypothetical protein
MVDEMTPAERRKLKAEYNWILGLTSLTEDPTGSIQKFWKELKRTIDASKGDTTIVDKFVDDQLPRIAAFAGMAVDPIRTTIVDAQAVDDPIIAAEIDRVIEVNRQTVEELAGQRGIKLTPERAVDLARQARRNDWSQAEILLNMRADLENTLMEGDTTGTAGDYQNALMQWASRNGLTLSKESAAKYVMNMTIGSQSLDDVKADLRRTYLAGAYPAWSDKINQGYDPADIFEPYVADIRGLLEDDNIGLSDPLMQQITQKVGADGKPIAVPLYEAKQMARQDPRWQKTDNAYETYANVAQNLLRTFGFA